MSLDLLPIGYIYSITGEGVATMYNPDFGWVGNLIELMPNEYYWFYVGNLPYEPYPFSFDCEE